MWPLDWRYARFDFWGLACSKCGSRRGWRVSGSAQRRCSFVAAVTCRDCGAEYFFKKYRHPGQPMAFEAQREYQVLQNLGRDSGRTFLVPRVYDVCAATCAFSMELLPGIRLDERLKKTRDRQVFDEGLRLAAIWLRGLHRYQVHCEMGLDHAGMLGQIESHCAPLTARNPLARSGLESMRNSLSDLERFPAKRVPLHGDFKASNLIQTNAGLYGIDIGLKFKNEGAMDTAQFIADLMLNRHAIKALGKDHDVAGMVDVFMQAYGDNSRENRNRTAWWLLFFILSWWQRELDSWKPALLVDRLYAKALAEVIAFSAAIQ